MGSTKSLGYYNNEEDAALAYNEGALKFFGNHAYTNVIGSDNSAIEVESLAVKQRRRKSKLGFKGVHGSEKGKFRSNIFDSTNKKMLTIGVFENPEQAAKAYDAKAIELHGDKAILNFPSEI